MDHQPKTNKKTQDEPTGSEVLPSYKNEACHNITMFTIRLVTSVTTPPQKLVFLSLPHFSKLDQPKFPNRTVTWNGKKESHLNPVF